MLEHSDGLIAMAFLGSARGSRAGFGGLAETIGFQLEQSWVKSSRSRGSDRQHARPRTLPRIALQPRFSAVAFTGDAKAA
jgi:hypothetical protein